MEGWELDVGSDSEGSSASHCERRPMRRPSGVFGRKRARNIRDRLLEDAGMMPLPLPQMPQELREERLSKKS